VVRYAYGRATSWLDSQFLTVFKLRNYSNMHLRTKLLSAALAAAFLLALGAGTASASRSFSVVGGGRAVRATARALTFAGSNRSRAISDVTLNGSVHSLTGKTRGALVGIITRGETGNIRCEPINCTSIRVNTPNHIVLLSFTGTLPNITGMTLGVEGDFTIDFNGRPRCRYQGLIEATAGGRAAAGQFTISTLTPVPGNNSRLIEATGEEFFRRCDLEGELSGRFTLSPEVTVRLH